MLARHSEVAAHDLGPRVVLAEDAHKIGEGLLVQRDGPAQVPRVLVGVGEVVAGGEGLGVVLAEDPHEIGEGLLVQGDAVTALAARAANAGMFDVFLEVRPDEASSYRFGREPDGTPSQSWNWQEPASQNHGLRTRQPDA